MTVESRHRAIHMRMRKLSDKTQTAYILRLASSCSTRVKAVTPGTAEAAVTGKEATVTAQAEMVRDTAAGTANKEALALDLLRRPV
jgi:hypothetical protein